ncbi:MAG: CPBP family intramembrane metalloprotease [Acidobacteriota bacterium]|nr:MAG: CPBP family intramembrane metalloprotease [Acidobacteriota bacterium]
MSKSLCERPVVAVGALIVAYLCAEILSEIARASVQVTDCVAGLFVKAAIFATFALLVVPLGLGLPSGRMPPRSYVAEIGLTKIQPLRFCLLIALSCYLIFALSHRVGSFVYLSSAGLAFELDLSKFDLLATRSVIPAIFEELVFRGVMVTLLLRYTTRSRTVLISAAIFAGLHALNLLNPRVDSVWVVCQVVWAFGLGVMYAEIYLLVRSLLPVILIHYLVNASVGVWFQGLDAQTPVTGLYGVVFFGLLPAGLSFLWVRWLAQTSRVSRLLGRRWEKTERLRYSLMPIDGDARR